jgi:hypothetical protein
MVRGALDLTQRSGGVAGNPGEEWREEKSAEERECIVF